MKLTASSSEIPAGLDLLAQLFPAAAPAVASLKAGLIGVSITGSLVVSKTVTPSEHATLEVDLSA
jgi:hypothetical protein